jgi:hypothetical protein
MDKEWTKQPRLSGEYKKGVLSFLDFAYTKGKPEANEILCPCANCANIYYEYTHIYVMFLYYVQYQFIFFCSVSFSLNLSLTLLFLLD